MTDKEKFFKALKDPSTRELMIKKLEQMSLENRMKEFEISTGYELSEFLFLLKYKKIIIEEINKEDYFTCKCGTIHKIYKREEIKVFSPPNPSEYTQKISMFYCSKCGQKISVYGEIKRIEAISY